MFSNFFRRKGLFSMFYCVKVISKLEGRTGTCDASLESVGSFPDDRPNFGPKYAQGRVSDHLEHFGSKEKNCMGDLPRLFEVPGVVSGSFSRFRFTIRRWEAFREKIRPMNLLLRRNTSFLFYFFMSNSCKILKILLLSVPSSLSAPPRAFHSLINLNSSRLRSEDRSYSVESFKHTETIIKSKCPC